MKSKVEIEKRILNLMEEILDLESNTVLVNQTFDDLGLDSVQFVRLAIQCELEYNIKIDETMLENSEYPNIDFFIEYIYRLIDNKK